MNNNKNKKKMFENVSKKIQFLMNERNINIEEFAEKTELTYHRVKTLITKTAKRLTVLDILKISCAFDVSADWLVGRKI